MEYGIKFKKLKSKAITPTRGTSKSAGYDLYACLVDNNNAPSSVIIESGLMLKIPTGLAIAIPDGYAGFIFARSGIATKQGLRPANCVGVCDSDYRGEYIVPLYNDSVGPQIIRHGERIAQLIIMPYLTNDLEEVDVLDETERGVGGFGSTGVQ